MITPNIKLKWDPILCSSCFDLLVHEGIITANPQGILPRASCDRCGKPCLGYVGLKR